MLFSEFGFELGRDGVLENSASGVVTHCLTISLGGEVHVLQPVTKKSRLPAYSTKILQNLAGESKSLGVETSTL